ncbi:hypothetical protein EJB05_02903 [Eragrostis curvula]|uniref:Uncharacterized protein n=1 Tax=Eragrostis curvula TaxID=38414 RepID=A0A5J9WTS3_9POAL|nr:hypothetical protein EJB05_02903 [Eragrostis curvula]
MLDNPDLKKKKKRERKEGDRPAGRGRSTIDATRTNLQPNQIWSMPVLTQSPIPAQTSYNIPPLPQPTSTASLHSVEAARPFSSLKHLHTEIQSGGGQATIRSSTRRRPRRQPQHRHAEQAPLPSSHRDLDLDVVSEVGVREREEEKREWMV